MGDVQHQRHGMPVLRLRVGRGKERLARNRSCFWFKVRNFDSNANFGATPQSLRKRDYLRNA
jgi:hypothetical protein